MFGLQKSSCSKQKSPVRSKNHPFTSKILVVHPVLRPRMMPFGIRTNSINGTCNFSCALMHILHFFFLFSLYFPGRLSFRFVSSSLSFLAMADEVINVYSYLSCLCNVVSRLNSKIPTKLVLVVHVAASTVGQKFENI